MGLHDLEQVISLSWKPPLLDKRGKETDLPGRHSSGIAGCNSSNCRKEKGKGRKMPQMSGSYFVRNSNSNPDSI